MAKTALRAFLIVIVVHATAHAQTATPSDRSGSVGVSFQQMVPRGDFRENTQGADRSDQAAFGFNLIGHVNSSVTLRLEYFFGTYYKNPCGGYCDRDLFRAVGVGSELVLPRGPVRPYLTGGLGRISFSSFDEADGSEADTGAGYWMYGAGVRIPAGRKWSIDLALRHFDAGPVSYLHLQRNPDGSVADSSARTRTPFDMFLLGLQYTLGGT